MSGLTPDANATKPADKNGAVGCLILVIGAVVLALFGQCSGGASTSTSAASASASTNTNARATTMIKTAPSIDSEPTPVPTASIGMSASDGAVAFTVTKLKTAIWVGQYTKHEPQGIWVVAYINAVNRGAMPVEVLGGNQYLYDASGRQYGSDTVASLYIDKESSAEINPGNLAQLVLFWDVPVGTKVDHLELHSSTWSTGVQISIPGVAKYIPPM